MTDSLEFKGRIVRNENSEMKIHAGNYWGIDVIDFRWYDNEKPTRKGIRMNRKEAKLLLEILNKIMEE